ncbi:hypothetical protein EDB84DRAFT_1440314 [Lactarius hengduanensis]|nr:hypothetical protein EDB84DRAFT_1440314 [Lactarius hengduanensis]
MWEIGGVAIVPLRLIQLARSRTDTTRTLKNSWYSYRWSEKQLAELQGYGTHAHSTITNPVAYRSIALDFELWSRTRGANRNNLLGLASLGDLLSWQTSWYSFEALPSFLKLFRAVMESSFVADDAIKPVLSYLVAHLHNGLSSPASVLSQIDDGRSREKAEQLFGAFVSILSDSPDCYIRFAATLPLTCIYLLLLGDKPSSFVAKQVLDLIALSLHKSKSFSRKFELVSGWTIVKTVLPDAWDSNVHATAFGILLG